MNILKKLYYRIRFGRVKERVTAQINGIASEIEILDRNNNIVGFWAYGYYDPSHPYNGD